MKYFKKRRLIRKWKEKADRLEKSYSPYQHAVDLKAWEIEVYRRAIRRVNGEKAGYWFENLLQQVREDYGPKFITTEEKEYREYIHNFICDNIDKVSIKMDLKDRTLDPKKLKWTKDSLKGYLENVDLTLDEYLEKVDVWFSTFEKYPYMTFEQWKRDKRIGELLDK